MNEELHVLLLIVMYLLIVVVIVGLPIAIIHTSFFKKSPKKREYKLVKRLVQGFAFALCGTIAGNVCRNAIVAGGTTNSQEEAQYIAIMVGVFAACSGLIGAWLVGKLFPKGEEKTHE